MSANRYVRLGKLNVTLSFQSLSEEEQWGEWQNIQDNEEPEEDPTFVTLDQWGRMTKEEQKDVLQAKGKAKFNDQGDNEGIQWALWSWNPVTGCKHDCPYCYARDIAERLYDKALGFSPAIHPERLSAPHNATKPEGEIADLLKSETQKEKKRVRALGLGNVFTCSMADLFGRWVPTEWIEVVLEQVRNSPQWTFLFLTKFPIRMAEFDFPQNAWVGTTVDCQVRVANAEKAFRKVKAGVKWLSCEPLIEPLKFKDLAAFQWVVIGGASRSKETPEWFPPAKWVVDLEQDCYHNGVPFYEKPNIGFPAANLIQCYPGDKPQLQAALEAPEPLRYLPKVEER